jgi:hypothetical protein
VLKDLGRTVEAAEAERRILLLTDNRAERALIVERLGSSS